MGLLMSDTPLIDPVLDETLRLRDSLRTWAYGLDIDRAQEATSCHILFDIHHRRQPVLERQIRDHLGRLMVDGSPGM